MEMHEVAGLDGLALSIPKGYAIKPEGDSLRVFVPEQERKSRSPVQISVSVTERRPAWTGMDEKEVGGRNVHYVVVEGEGGSGGATLELKAWVAAEGRFFVLESTVQPESGGDSEFRAEWAILPTMRWGGKRGL